MKHPLHDICWMLINNGEVSITNCGLRCPAGSENKQCTCNGPIDCPLGHPNQKVDEQLQQERKRLDDIYKRYHR